MFNLLVGNIQNMCLTSPSWLSLTLESRGENYHEVIRSSVCLQHDKATILGNLFRGAFYINMCF